MKKFLLNLLTISILAFSTAAYAENLKFVQITDVHLSENGDSFSSRNVSESVSTLQKAVNSVNNISNLDFIVFTGDNTDSSTTSSFEIFGKITQNLDRPYFIVLGNHDSYKFGGIAKPDYLNLIKKYNKYQYVNKSYFYFFPNPNFIVIIMDGSTPLIPSSHGFYPDNQLSWLDNVLTKYKDKKALIFQHFPVVEPHENKSHRTIYVEKYLDVLAKHDNVAAIISGHYHSDKVTLDKGIYHINTSALVEYPHKYRVVDINYDKDASNQGIKLKTELIPLAK